MDPRTNPYAPGAGTPPPELAGRATLIERVSIALDRIRNRLPARSFIFYGLRGVGKTVLLNRIRLDAEARGFAVARMEAPEERSLPALLLPALRSMLIRLSRGAAVRDKAQRALKAAAGFATAFKVKYGDIEFGVDIDAERGLADSGDLDSDLSELLSAVGEAASESRTAAILFIDELQYVPEEQLTALFAALHRAGQDSLPITMVAAGLPQLLGLAGRAKSYAERLFEFIPVDRLDEENATEALAFPAGKNGVDFEPAAIKEIHRQTQGYPYFLQEWGKHSWDRASGPPIRLEDVRDASVIALSELDAGFFRVRFDRLAPSEKAYLAAMAALGPGPHRSGDIAARLGKGVTAVAPVRASLIKKGMVFSAAHGETAFTVPLFDGFMNRMAGWL
ncbi:MAG: AAA family ATPase [Phyllobacteriaceae bacterium]|nr:AAA family ATPase [Phyllobacteriaceae bacterium]